MIIHLQRNDYRFKPDASTPNVVTTDTSMQGWGTYRVLGEDGKWPMV